VGGDEFQALLLLAVVLAIAFWGVVLITGGSRRGALLAARGGVDHDSQARASVRLDAWIRRRPWGRRLNDWLHSAGVDLAPVDFLSFVFTGVVVATLALSLVMGERAAFVAAVIGGWFGARGYVRRRRDQRVEAFVAQLPDLSRTLANATAAGLSLPQAIRLAGRELPDPAGAEMRRVMQELDLGRGLDDALEALGRRLPSREVSVLMTTLIIQQRAGGDTVKALAELGQTLEARKDLIREVKTLLAGSVYTGYVVPVIALGSLLLMNTVSPGVIEDLTSSLLGLVVLCISGSLWALAIVLIRRTTRVEL
jgi:tight adherence protein B